MNMTLGIIIGYLVLLLALGLFSGKFFKGTAKDYFVASHSIGPFMLLMSIFGTTMTAFALVGSTGQAYSQGIGVYGLMASWSGLIHAAVFFIIGLKLWSVGRRLGFVTQCQFFRQRFESSRLGYLLFPILVGLVVPYLLIGLLGAGRVVLGVTRGAYPGLSETGGIPPWITGLVICLVVLMYVFYGGLRGAVWANTFQTLVFMVMGLVAFFMIAHQLGGFAHASQKVLEVSPQHLAREGLIGKTHFLTYCLVPLSVGMFPHLFQHWLTAKNATSFKLTVVAHPICIMLVWLPCILIGIWAIGAGVKVPDGAVLGVMVAKLKSPLMTGLITAGILAAIMSSLDSQFLCLGSMFTNDIVVHQFGKDHFSDKQKILMARLFTLLIVAITYVLSLTSPNKVFVLGVWCFSGFAGLFPLVLAALYWQRTTKAGAYACIMATLIAWIFFFVRSDNGATEGLILGMMPVLFIVLISAAALIVVSLLTQPPSRETLALFFTPAKAEAR